jgi:hypothetical protein
VLFFRGQANEIGFVPNKGFFAPAGATLGLYAVHAIPIKFFSANASVSCHKAAK